MKTKAQKAEALKEATKLYEKSKVVLFSDFTKVTAEDLRRLRREMKNADAKYVVLKKRLANVMFKEKGVDYDVRQFEASVGTIFSEGDIEKPSAALYKFFSTLGEKADREANIKKILGAYDVVGKRSITGAELTMIGQLPPREVLLSQLLGMFTAPMKAFLYILDQKSKAETK